MAVDYAYKYRERNAEKWALRNIKLRMSRKILFISGLFMSLSWAMENQDTADNPLLVNQLIAHLKNWTKRAPLESLAMIVERHAPSLADDVFGPYDSFLQLLNDQDRRKELANLTPDVAYQNNVFLDAREVASRFDDALIRILFDSDEKITHLVRKYGVF